MTNSSTSPSQGKLGGRQPVGTIIYAVPDDYQSLADTAPESLTAAPWCEFDSVKEARSGLGSQLRFDPGKSVVQRLLEIGTGSDSREIRILVQKGKSQHTNKTFSDMVQGSLSENSRVIVPPGPLPWRSAPSVQDPPPGTSGTGSGLSRHGGITSFLEAMDMDTDYEDGSDTGEFPASMAEGSIQEIQLNEGGTNLNDDQTGVPKN